MVLVRACERAVVGLVLVLAMGCGDPESLPCEEEPTEGTRELERVSLMVRTTEVSAEVALDEEARRSAWAGRRCDLEALLWVPDAVGPAAVELCEVEVAVDLAFVRNGEVVAVDLARPPCDAPCETCPAHGADGADGADGVDGADGPAVDAVLWFPAGQVDVVVGDSVTGLDAVALPTG